MCLFHHCLSRKDLRRKANQGSILKSPFQAIDLWPKVDDEYFKPLTKEDKEVLNTFIIDQDTGEGNSFLISITFLLK